MKKGIAGTMPFAKSLVRKGLEQTNEFVVEQSHKF
jgi:hypothetical protein